MTTVSAVGTLERMENGRVLVLTLDQPPDNAIGPRVLEALGEAIEATVADDGLDLLVITGRGRVFSKGFDVEVIRAHPDPSAHRASLARCNDIVGRVERCPKPVLAAINGHCFGAGLELAMACHLRLCADRARLGLPELTRRLLPGLGGVPRLTALVGSAKALELVGLGDLITAAEAHRIGLVNRVLSAGDFMPGVLAFARALLSMDQALVREVVRLTAAAAPRRHPEIVQDAMDAAVRLAGAR